MNKESVFAELRLVGLVAVGVGLLVLLVTGHLRGLGKKCVIHLGGPAPSGLPARADLDF